MHLLFGELRRMGIGIAALSEVWKLGNGYISSEYYTYYWSGYGNGHSIRGVAVAVANLFFSSVLKVKHFDERIMSFISLVAVYGPTDVSEPEDE